MTRIVLTDELLTDEEVGLLRERLSRHYGVRVAPVNEYCEVFEDWFRALAVAATEYDATPEDKRGWRSPPPFYGLLGQLSAARIGIYKSNYLWRRLYGGDAHRTEKCPVHQGRWSGCSFDDPCPEGCQWGYDVTGWLPARHVFEPNDKPKWVEYCRVCAGLATALVHEVAA